MNTVTHALAPVILVKVLGGRFLKSGWRSFLAIGIAGALPDILNPHISLESRMTSWSHGLPCWIAFTLVVLTVATLSRKRIPYSLALLIAASYLLHLFCDAISGGINWMYPISSLVWGRYWVSPLLWIPLDVFFVISCYVVFRAFPKIKQNRVAGGI
jgi:putative exporter of polyketide antibiotics